MVLNISVLFSESSDRDFVIILTNKNAKNAHKKLLEEFGRRGFRRCCECTSQDVSSVALFDPKTNAETSETMTIPGGKHSILNAETVAQTIDTHRVKEKWFYQAMYFKTTWKSKTMGLRLQGKVASFSSKHFSPYEEIAQDQEPTQSNERDDTSTSGYGTRSTSSSMVAEKVMTGKEMVDEVLRVVALDLKADETGKVKYNSIQAWLETLNEPNASIPEILPTEDLDRKLGNIKEALVGPEGKKISIRSYDISIPPNAVRTKTRFRFRVSLELELLDYPEHLMPISLPLYCSPGDLDFGEKITMRLATWLRKDDLSQSSDPIPVFVYTQRKGHEWQCIESTNLTSTGYIEFKCGHFCVNAAFINKSDVDKVRFAIEHILFRDNHGAYTSCHFLASDPFVDAMLRHLEENSTIIHSPTYTSLARPGDEIRIALESKNPENYRFESEDSCVLKISEEFYVMKRRESFSFLITPKPLPDTIVEFVYVIGEKRSLKRDQLKETSGDAANIIVKGEGIAFIEQEGVNIVPEKRKRESQNDATEAKIPRRRLGCELTQTDYGETVESLAHNVEHIQGRSRPLSVQDHQETCDFEEADEEEETTPKEVYGN